MQESTDEMIRSTDEMIREIKKRSIRFVLDNIPEPSPADFLYAENAMIIGAQIALEKHLGKMED